MDKLQKIKDKEKFLNQLEGGKEKLFLNEQQLAVIREVKIVYFYGIERKFF